MQKFQVTILGCGSALPTTNHNPTSQLVNVREKLFMIDCGEGTQLQLRKSKVKFSRLNHIFISHLHGDHCFGLMGVISTFGLLGRTAPLFIHAQKELQGLLQKQLDFFCHRLPYKVVFEHFNPSETAVIYEDRSVTVTTIPLKHRIQCAGFLFAEKALPNHLNRPMIDFYQIPVSKLQAIKLGADYETETGELVLNERLTTPSIPPRKYAYCSDTMYYPPMIEQIKGVNLLFHESTFAESEAARAKETGHSTASQAAQVAKEAGAIRLLIGHYSARYPDENVLLEEAKTVFEHTLAAKEGLIIEV